MKVTQVKVVLIKNMERLKGSATVVFDDCFKVRDVIILPKGETGELYIAMPSKKIKNKYISLAYPIDAEFRQEIEKAVLDEYHRLVAEGGNEETDESEPAVSSEEE